MLIFRLPDTPVTPERHRRFRVRLGVAILIALVLLALQYSRWALLPASRASALWGVLAGLVVAGVVVDRRLSSRRLTTD